MSYVGFDALKNKLAGKAGVHDPAALAASIGRRKYGKKAMSSAARSGKSPRYHKQLSSFVRKHG